MNVKWGPRPWFSFSANISWCHIEDFYPQQRHYGKATRDSSPSVGKSWVPNTFESIVVHFNLSPLPSRKTTDLSAGQSLASPLFIRPRTWWWIYRSKFVIIFIRPDSEKFFFQPLISRLPWSRILVHQLSLSQYSLYQCWMPLKNYFYVALHRPSKNLNVTIIAISCCSPMTATDITHNAKFSANIWTNCRK